MIPFNYQIVFIEFFEFFTYIYDTNFENTRLYIATSYARIIELVLLETHHLRLHLRAWERIVTEQVQIKPKIE